MKNISVFRMWGVYLILALMTILLHSVVPRVWAQGATFCMNCAGVTASISGNVWQDPSSADCPVMIYTNPIAAVPLTGCGPWGATAGGYIDLCDAPYVLYATITPIASGSLIMTNIVQSDGYFSCQIILVDPTQTGTFSVTATAASGDAFDDSVAGGCAEISVTTTASAVYTPPSTTSAASAGCSTCSSSPSSANSMGSANGDNNSVQFRFNLGKSTVEGDAGYLWLDADTPSTALAQPSSLKLPYLAANVELITNTDGSIAQVKHTSRLGERKCN